TARALKLPRIDGEPGNQVVDQIAVTPTRSVTDFPLSDLYAIVGDNLYLYPPSYPSGVYDAPQLIGGGWGGRTITATSWVGDPALFARNDRTGELDLWVGSTANGIPAGSPTGTRYTYARCGFDAREVPVIAGADINVDGKPDLWALTRTGDLKAYL